MEPRAYNTETYQRDSEAIAIALPHEDELLSKGESVLILAALCTLAMSILSVTVL